MTNEVEDTIFAGVWHVLRAAEDFEGPFLIAFKRLQPMLGQLKEVYEREDAAVLDSRRGCYSPGMAVEEALIRYDVMREEDAFGMEG